MNAEKKRKIEEAYQKQWGTHNNDNGKTLEDLIKLYHKSYESISTEINNDKQKTKALPEEIQGILESQKLANSLIQESLSLNLPNSKAILENNININKNLLQNKDYIKSANEAINLAKGINSDIYKFKLDAIKNQEKQFHNIEYAKPIEFRNYANEMLKEFKIQNEKLNIVIEYLKTQNESLDIQIEQDKASSDKQIKKLQEQIIQLDTSSKTQGRYNRIAIGITLLVAILSIYFSFETTKISADKTEEIYIKENVSGDNQHNELKKILENNSNKDLIFEDKQLKVLNQILETIKNEKITK
ncbi:MAG: hypothetical protein WC149_06785 [Arcobacteraceae bacterium]